MNSCSYSDPLTNPMSLVKQFYVNACLTGNVNIMTDMIQTETNKIKNDEFLGECLNGACAGGYNNIVEVILNYRNVTNHDTLYCAYKGGNEVIINKILKMCESPKLKITDKWNKCALGACEGGRLNLFKNVINSRLDKNTLSINFWCDCLYAASSMTRVTNIDSNVELIKFIINNYIRGDIKKITKYDWNTLLISACKGGCLEIVNMFIDYGANNWNGGLLQACFGGYLQIIKLMIKKGATNWNGGLEYACWGGHVEIVKFMTIKGATKLNKGLQLACMYGFYEIVRLLVVLGANNFNECLASACYSGDLSIVRLLIANGSTDWNSGLECAFSQGHVALVNLMLKNGATNFSSCVDKFKYDVDVGRIKLVSNY